jgi:hypothetical protein
MGENGRVPKLGLKIEKKIGKKSNQDIHFVR